ncbi:hypothetical protein DXG01_012872 [Tephrocybe rancida]|nr:hypothetical protein DXG01_012872 [Tephrocybe rancida]
MGQCACNELADHPAPPAALRKFMRLPMFSRLMTRLCHTRPPPDATPVNPLFSFTSGHWLRNNDGHMSGRFAPFNVEGLKDVASTLMGSKVQSIEKLAESFNRVFLLTSEDGQQVIARIPTPISGPPHFSTASEVATMDFLQRLGLPLPKVLAWSSRAHSTPVNSEFIIMEKAAGQLLADVLETESVDQEDLFHKLVALHRPLLDLRFNCYGSIYYKQDLDSSLRSIPDFLELESAPPGLDLTSFVVGPSSRRNFWEDERASMDFEHGPWTEALTYMYDVAMREQSWIDRHAKPHLADHFLCGLPFQGQRDDHIEALEYYKYVVTCLVPSERRYLHGYLWHPDLHAGNLFVSASGPPAHDGKLRLNITSCIDWQGAWVGPAFLQLAVPKVYRATFPEFHNQLPTDVHIVDAAERLEFERLHREAVYHRRFEAEVLGDMMELPALNELRELEDLSHCTWRTGLIPFREIMIQLWKQWPKVAPNHKCPINFTPSECEAYENAYRFWLEHRKHAYSLDKEFDLGEAGYVQGDLEKFDDVYRQLEKRRKEWVEMGRTPGEQMVKELLWPYRNSLADNPRKHMMVDMG